MQHGTDSSTVCLVHEHYGAGLFGLRNGGPADGIVQPSQCAGYGRDDDEGRYCRGQRLLERIDFVDFDELHTSKSTSTDHRCVATVPSGDDRHHRHAYGEGQHRSDDPSRRAVHNGYGIAWLTPEVLDSNLLKPVGKQPWANPLFATGKVLRAQRKITRVPGEDAYRLWPMLIDERCRDTLGVAQTTHLCRARRQQRPACITNGWVNLVAKGVEVAHVPSRIVTDLRVVYASSAPSMEYSRPMPLCLMPP